MLVGVVDQPTDHGGAVCAASGGDVALGRGVQHLNVFHIESQRDGLCRVRRASELCCGTLGLVSVVYHTKKCNTVLILGDVLAINNAMSESAISVVMCEACNERVAEIVAEDGRVSCSECHLGQSQAEPPREPVSDSED